MKLLYCLECLDIVALRRQVRECSCRRSSGRYEADDITAVVSGSGVVIGIDTAILERAVRDRKREGAELRAFLVGPASEHVIRVDRAQLRYLQPLRRRA